MRSAKCTQNHKVDSSSFLLSIYPLTPKEQEECSKVLGENVNFINIRSISEFGLPRAFCYLVRLKVKILYLKSEATNAVQTKKSFLLLAALITRSRSILWVDSEHKLTPVQLSEILREISNTICSFLDIVLSIMSSVFHRIRLKSLKKTELRWNSNKEILYLRSSFPDASSAGGADAHTAGVINGFVKLGYKVTFLSGAIPFGLAKEVRVELVTGIEHLGLPKEGNFFRLHRLMHKRAYELVRKNRPTFIYQRLTLGDFSGALLSREFNIPLIVEYNGSEVWAMEKWGKGVFFKRAFHQAEDLLLRNAEAIITISKELYAQLQRRGLDCHRLAWHPNGVDLGRFNPAQFTSEEREEIRQSLGILKNEYAVIFVGTFGRWHGAEVFAEAATYLTNKQPLSGLPKIKYVFIGDGITRQQCVDIISAFPIAVPAFFTGKVNPNDIPKYLAAADALISPHVPNPDGSPFFGSPTKLFEYMAMGKPIIVSELDQLADIFEDEFNALLVKPGNPKEIAEAILRLINDPELSFKISRSARKTVCDYYSWDEHVKSITALIKSRQALANNE